MAGFDIGGSVLAGQALVSPIAELIKKNQQDQQDSSQADALVEAAVRSGMMTPEEHQKYITSGLQQKKGIVGALTINWAHEQQRKQQEFQQQQHSDAIQQQAIQNEYHNRALQQTWDIANLKADTGSNDSIQVDPFIDPVSKQPVPGIGIVRKTGQAVPFAGMLEQGGVKIETDQATGLKFYRDAKGNPKPLDPTKVLQSSLTRPESTPAPTAAPSATPAATPMVPKPGDVRRGYRFKGGNPADQANWEKVG